MECIEKYKMSGGILSVIEESCVPIAVYQFVDRRVTTLALSAGFREMFGLYDRDEAYSLMDNNMYRDTHPDDKARVANAAFLFAVKDEDYNVVYRNKLFGEYRIIHSRGWHIHSEDGTRVAVVCYMDEGPYKPGNEVYSEISGSGFCNLVSNVLQQESFYREQYYDYLTGLPNMAYFFEIVEAGRRKITEKGEPYAILFFNFKGMKLFNRNNGFAEGNRLLRAFTNVLVSHFTCENCSRFGQDHFAAFTHIRGLEERLRVIFDECGTINDGNNLPVRVGIYIDYTGSSDINDACDKAKTACDFNNKEGTSSSFTYYDSAMLESVINRQYIIENLDRAIDENWIRVYYQPIVRTANGRVCDEEALARWIDPVKGFLSPADFIPILEDASLIYKMDLYVVEETLRKMKKQAEEGLHVVSGSINLSRSDFDACDIVEEIRRRVDAAGVERSKINIEITESIIGGDFEFMKEQIERFRKLGFQVWMDDFGSGYSSLDVLQSIEFDLIKFDMRFMQQFDNTTKSRVILTELIKMALSLGIDTVTEGVENIEQVEFLKDIGCSKIQGFYYCRPIPMDEIINRYRTGRQIGFENPLESDYYSAIGRINLYDPTSAGNISFYAYQHFFNSVAMAVLELNNGEITVIRCNKPYETFLKDVIGVSVPESGMNETKIGKEFENDTLFDIAEWSRTGNKWIQILDAFTDGGASAHSYLRYIASNPVTGAVAAVVIVLDIQ